MNKEIGSNQTDEIEIKESDLEIQSYRLGNKVSDHYNAVRIKHIPTGIIVMSEKKIPRARNRKLAMEKLKELIKEIK